MHTTFRDIPSRGPDTGSAALTSAATPTLPTTDPTPGPDHPATCLLGELTTLGALQDVPTVLAGRLDLLAWVSAAAQDHADGTLPDEQRHTLDLLLGEHTLTDLAWDHQYARLSSWLDEHPAADLADDATLTDPDLSWVRAQQQHADQLTDARRARLDRLPGWRWHSYHDLLVADDLPGLRYLAHSGDEASRAFARLVYLLPVDAVGRMCAVADDAGARITAVLREAATPHLRERGLHLLALTQLLPESARTEQNVSFLAVHLEHTSDPHVAHTVLAFLTAHSTDPTTSPGAGPAPSPTPAPAPILAAGPGLVPGSRWPLSATHPLAHRHIACLGLAARTHNALLRAEITRVGEVLAIEDPHTLLELRGFGITCLDDLRTRLVASGIDPPFGPAAR